VRRGIGRTIQDGSAGAAVVADKIQIQQVVRKPSRSVAMNAQARTIAIVDDDAAVCDSMRVLLEAYAIDVWMYPSGTDFLRANPVVACVTVDYRMPGLNGLDFVSELRRRGSTVPAIMISATSDPTVERRAAEIGIKHVLRKPVSAQVLLGVIREALE
jgi:two-component system, LuxR family, response regulator FixJ